MTPAGPAMRMAAAPSEIWLQAAAVCHQLGVNSDALLEGLSQCSSPPGRLEPVTNSVDEFTVYMAAVGKVE